MCIVVENIFTGFGRAAEHEIDDGIEPTNKWNSHRHRDTSMRKKKKMKSNKKEKQTAIENGRPAHKPKHLIDNKMRFLLVSTNDK